MNNDRKKRDGIGPKLFLAMSLLAALAAPAAPVFALATPTGLVNYQGVLRSAAGAPLSGTYDMVFRFVDAPIAAPVKRMCW